MLVDRHGAEAVAAFRGTMNYSNLTANHMLPAFLEALGSNAAGTRADTAPLRPRERRAPVAARLALGLGVALLAVGAWWLVFQAPSLRSGRRPRIAV